jgi:hypothetical protein
LRQSTKAVRAFATFSRQRRASAARACSLIALVFCAAAFAPGGAARGAEIEADADPNAPVVSPNTSLPDASPESIVEIRGQRFSQQPGRIQILLNAQHPISNDGDAQVYISADKVERTRSDAGKPEEDKISFRLPKDIALGRYHVAVQMRAQTLPDGTEVKAKTIRVPGELRVITKEPPKITAVKPITGYPGEKNRFQFELTGEHFARNADDNAILINGSAIPRIRDCKAKPVDHSKEGSCVLISDDARTLSVYGYKADPYQGPVTVQVRANGMPSAEQPMLLSRIPRNQALPLAIFGALALTGMLIAIVWSGLGRYTIGQERYSPFAVFFLDKATNTYSLSKLQLFAWTAAAVFGYIYLMIANLLIQWKFAMPDLPEGLPLLMGISAGTTVTAIGITNQFGGKGSGPVHPSAADFITSGGLIAPERFQFFIWTVVGIAGFLSLLLLADPSTLHQMPKLPENFLTIMGISSAAYLGGKAVRKAGPIIKTFAIKQIKPPAPPPAPGEQRDDKAPRGPVIVLNLKGDNLDVKGTLKLNDKVLRSDQFSIEPRLSPEPPSTMSGELDANLDLGKIDTVKPDSLLEGVHTLTLINGDGQSASIRFPLDPMKITASAPPLSTGSTPAPVTLTVENYSDGTTAKWKPPQSEVEVDLPNPVRAATPPPAIGEATPAASGAAAAASARVTVQIAPRTRAGDGTIILVSPLGLRASRTLPVTGGPVPPAGNAAAGPAVSPAAPPAVPPARAAAAPAVAPAAPAAAPGEADPDDVPEGGVPHPRMDGGTHD